MYARSVDTCSLFLYVFLRGHVSYCNVPYLFFFFHVSLCIYRSFFSRTSLFPTFSPTWLSVTCILVMYFFFRVFCFSHFSCVSLFPPHAFSGISFFPHYFFLGGYTFTSLHFSCIILCNTELVYHLSCLIYITFHVTYTSLFNVSCILKIHIFRKRALLSVALLGKETKYMRKETKVSCVLLCKHRIFTSLFMYIL